MNSDPQQLLRLLRRDAAFLLLAVCLDIYNFAFESPKGPLWFSLLLTLAIGVRIMWLLLTGGTNEKG